MLIVSSRNTFLPATSEGAVVVAKYRHVQIGEPALNCRLRMTSVDVSMFEALLKTGAKEAFDIVAGRTTTYTITEG